MDREMDLLLSEKELKIGDKKVVVKRIALLDTIRLASHVSDVVSLVLKSSELFSQALYKVTYNGGDAGDGEKPTQSDIDGVRVLGLVEMFGIIGEDGTELLKDLIVKSTNLTDKEVEEIDCISGIDIVSTIFEVNKDFFLKCMSKLKEKMSKFTKKEKEDKSK